MYALGVYNKATEQKKGVRLMTPRQKAHTERISTFLSEDQLERLKQASEKKGLTVSALIRLIIIEYLEKQK